MTYDYTLHNCYENPRLLCVQTWFAYSSQSNPRIFINDEIITSMNIKNVAVETINVTVNGGTVIINNGEGSNKANEKLVNEKWCGSVAGKRKKSDDMGAKFK